MNVEITLILPSIAQEHSEQSRITEQLTSTLSDLLGCVIQIFRPGFLPGNRVFTIEDELARQMAKNKYGDGMLKIDPGVIEAIVKDEVDKTASRIALSYGGEAKVNIT